MDTVTGPFDIFFNHGGWRESWPVVWFLLVIIAIIYFGLKLVHRDNDED